MHWENPSWKQPSPKQFLLVDEESIRCSLQQVVHVIRQQTNHVLNKMKRSPLVDEEAHRKGTQDEMNPFGSNTMSIRKAIGV